MVKPKVKAKTKAAPAKPAPTRHRKKLLLIIPILFLVIGIAFVSSRLFHNEDVFTGGPNAEHLAQDVAADKAISSNASQDNKPATKPSAPTSTAKPSPPAASSPTPNTSAPTVPPGDVSDAWLTVDNSTLATSGNDCGKNFTFHFSGVITTSGAATVSYRWLESGHQDDLSGQWGWQSLSFSRADSKEVNLDVTKMSTAYNSYSGTVRINIGAPNITSSNTVPYRFVDNCS